MLESRPEANTEAITTPAQQKGKTVVTPTVHDAIRAIEQLSRCDPGGRGLAAHAPLDTLYPAARTLLESERIVIVTGFCIRAAQAGETDGPPGALDIADALLGLGKRVVLVTDEYSAPLLAAGAAVAGIEVPIAQIDLPQESADRTIDELLGKFAPTHVLAIERPGNAADGHRYSMRGEMLDDLIPGADRLLDPPASRNFTTLAVGDGGNELGLGGLRAQLGERITHGELIFCATTADLVVPAGISNWGGYALAAALSLLSGKALLRSPAHERRVVEAMVAAGAVDGCTRQRALSVDGLPWDDYAGTLQDIFRHAGGQQA